jgi:excisionase family DNA binding protein
MSEAPTPELGRFMTVADVAESLTVSVNQAYLLVRSGELPAIKVGSSWRVERTMLQAYIDTKYEENRRANLWNQIDYSDLAEFTARR